MNQGLEQRGQPAKKKSAPDDLLRVAKAQATAATVDGEALLSMSDSSTWFATAFIGNSPPPGGSPEFPLRALGSRAAAEGVQRGGEAAQGVAVHLQGGEAPQ